MRSLTPLIALVTPFLALASPAVPQALVSRQEAEAPKWNFTDYAYFYVSEPRKTEFNLELIVGYSLGEKAVPTGSRSTLPSATRTTLVPGPR
jgi:hypothetical protein